MKPSKIPPVDFFQKLMENLAEAHGAGYLKQKQAEILYTLLRDFVASNHSMFESQELPDDEVLMVHARDWAEQLDSTEPVAVDEAPDEDGPVGSWEDQPGPTESDLDRIEREADEAAYEAGTSFPPVTGYLPAKIASATEASFGPKFFSFPKSVKSRPPEPVSSAAT